MILVLETRIFESDQSELQSVVPTLYVVKIGGNCILNAKKSKKQLKRPISLFSLWERCIKKNKKKLTTVSFAFTHTYTLEKLTLLLFFPKRT